MPSLSETSHLSDSVSPLLLPRGPNTFFDRVEETSTTTGTGTYTLGGAVVGFQSFACVGEANLCYYSAEDVDGQGNPSGGWEVGIGTYSAGTLARTTILASSNSNAAVSWSTGTRRIKLVSPAYWVNRASRVLLSTKIASGSASLDFTSLITSAYDEYEFDCLNILPANNSNVFAMRCSTNNGSSFDSGPNYFSCRLGWTTTAIEGEGSATDTWFQLCNATAMGNVSAHSQAGCTVRLINPRNTNGWKKIVSSFGCLFQGSALPLAYMVGGAYMSSSAVDAVQFLMTSGNITSGTIRMFGVVK